MTRQIATAVMGLAAIGVAVAGCGSEGIADVRVDGDVISSFSVETTAEMDCANGKRLNISGSRNTLAVTGTCLAVAIGGADNKITFENVDGQIGVWGHDNTIVYRGGDPKVIDTGSGNKIDKG